MIIYNNSTLFFSLNALLYTDIRLKPYLTQDKNQEFSVIDGDTFSISPPYPKFEGGTYVVP